MPTKFQKRHATRRKRLIAQTLQSDPYAETYQDTGKPCSKGHELPWRYVKGGACVRCKSERKHTKASSYPKPPCGHRVDHRIIGKNVTLLNEPPSVVAIIQE